MHSVSRTTHALAEAGADPSSLKASELNLGSHERLFRGEAFRSIVRSVRDRSARVGHGCRGTEWLQVDGAHFERIRSARIVGEPKPIRRKHAVISDDLHGTSLTLLRSVANQKHTR